MGTTAFSRGFLEQMVDSAIDLHGGHIMVLAEGYNENPNIRTYIKQPQPIAAVLDSMPDLTAAAIVSVSGMVSSPETAASVLIQGVQPEREKKVTTIARSIREGAYFSGTDGRNEIVIGEALAEKLNVRLGEKVVLMLSDLENNISSGAYRVAGIFRVASRDFEKANVYLPLREAQRLTGYGNAVTGFSIRLEDSDSMPAVNAHLVNKLDASQVEVLTWKERNKLIDLALQTYDFSLVITILILFIAIAFSIANSFLMVIYERIYEFGIMMANGVLPKKIRLMLYMETFLLTLLGLALGFVLTVVVLGYWSYAGLDLSNFAGGLSQFGVSPLIYPEFVLYDVVLGVIIINLIILASVLYPAFKASRFEVVDAIRFV